MSDTLPVVVQLWFKRPQQIPTYLNTLTPIIDNVGFNPQATPGIEIVPKLPGHSTDISNLHDQLIEQGLTLTHATRIKRQTFVADGLQRDYDLVRFHYYPSDVAYVHEDVDVEKLVNAFREIAVMGFFTLNVHLNRSEGVPWLSINFDGRVQRYIGEDLTKPVLVKKDQRGQKLKTPHPIQPKHVLEYKGEEFELV